MTTEAAPVPRDVLPVESRVVACTGLGVVLPKPRSGGEAKEELKVFGEMYMLFRVLSANSSSLAALILAGCVSGVPVTPGG